MTTCSFFTRVACGCCLLATTILPLQAAPSTPAQTASGWLNWRGPDQNGSSSEKDLPESLENLLWSADLPGKSTPVIANGKLYVMGYHGEGPDLQEAITCVNAETGQKLWETGYSDFLSDIIYRRYASSSPAVDPETGNVFIQGTQGILAGFSEDGKPLWNHSLMELYGRLTFPNGRTASPVIDRDLLITRGITANWGAHGPGADRFYAFDKASGDLVWASSPGDRPHDNSLSHPVLSWLKGKRVFYCATGDGSVVCVNVRTGDPLWRIPLFKAGINSSLVLHNEDKLIAIYGTPYEPGQMVALRIPSVLPTNSASGPVVVERSTVELWSNDLRTSASSPILAGDRVYLTSEIGNLVAVDVRTGQILWKLKLGAQQRSASPLYADGKLFVPIMNEPGKEESPQDGADEGGSGRGAFYIIRPSDTDGKIVSHRALDGRCFGSPAVYQGKVYLQTSRKLYCFGQKGKAQASASSARDVEKWPAAGAPTQLQIIPAEVLLHPGQTKGFRVRTLDEHGFPVEEVKDMRSIKWASFIPPTARVRATMNASFNPEGRLVAAADRSPSAGAFEGTIGSSKGYVRGRVLPGLPLAQDFESFALSETTTNSMEPPTAFAYPPLPWIGARFKFEVRDKDGNKVLTKTIDNRFFQRATVFMGDPALRNYTIEADVMSDGNRRRMSDVGVINQRYFIVLKGNEQKLEVNSNQELFRVATDFKWSPKIWYRLKARVDGKGDGTGVVRAKAWKKGEPEPEAWTLEAPNPHVHTNGCPGLFGFSPQERVYIDNVAVTSN